MILLPFEEIRRIRGAWFAHLIHFTPYTRFCKIFFKVFHYITRLKVTFVTFSIYVIKHHRSRLTNYLTCCKDKVKRKSKMHSPKRKGKQEETVELTFIIFKPFFGGKGGTSGRPLAIPWFL